MHASVAVMSPINTTTAAQLLTSPRVKVTKPTDPQALVLEAWAQGYMVGSIIIMLCITICNYRGKVLLHKLILLEVSEIYIY